jgi:hypothetical protein
MFEFVCLFDCLNIGYPKILRVEMFGSSPWSPKNWRSPRFLGHSHLGRGNSCQEEAMTGSGQSQAGILGFLELEGLEFWPLELAIGIRDCKDCYPLYLSFLLVYGLMKPKRSMGQFELRTASQAVLNGSCNIYRSSWVHIFMRIPKPSSFPIHHGLHSE